MSSNSDASARRHEGGAATDIADVIRANLLRLRRDRGLSLEALAQRAGIAVSVLEDLAAGRRFAGVELLWKLARALGQPCTAFIEPLGGPDKPHQGAGPAND